MKVNNPFFINSYHSPNYFCDRVLETNRLKDANENHRNITLFSLRKMGKTGLINHHIYLQIQEKSPIFFIYLDIFHTQNIHEFIAVFAKSLLGKLDSTPTKIIKKAEKFFTAFRPIITFDDFTGKPEIDIKFSENSDVDKTFDQLFSYIRSQEKQVIIAIDEFQQILQYPEKNVEATLRNHIQQTPNANFIFSGSHKHLLLSIFTDHARPFYQSTEMMQLGPIEHEVYKRFIEEKLALSGKKIEAQALDRILLLTRSHTYYVQFICNRLYASEFKHIENTEVDTILWRILNENEGIYTNYHGLLTSQQWNVLKAIAKEDGAMQLTSKEFIQKYQLGAASSVQTSVQALMAKEMIFEEKGVYYVYDVFLSHWLTKL